MREDAWLEFIGRGDPIYPGHPVTIACQIARAFPSLHAAQHDTGNGMPAARASIFVTGSGEAIYTALIACDQIAAGEPLATVRTWANTEWLKLAARYQLTAPAISVGRAQADDWLADTDLVGWIRDQSVPQILDPDIRRCLVAAAYRHAPRYATAFMAVVESSLDFQVALSFNGPDGLRALVAEGLRAAQAATLPRSPSHTP